MKLPALHTHHAAVIVVFFVLSLFPFFSFAQVQINGISTTVSTCANNGTITVNATTPNPPLIYSITAGPVTAPIQTNNVFNSLPAGTYTVRVSDAASSFLTQSATIGGNYLQPDFEPIIKRPFCAGGSDGRIIGNNIPGTGTGPFTWQLIAPSPVTTPPQASDTFRNLPAGNYTVRLTDACGGFRTVVSTLADPPVTSMSIITYPRVDLIGCDSAYFMLTLLTNMIRYPLTCTYQTSSGTFTTVVGPATDSSNFDGGTFSIEQVLPDFHFSSTVSVTITDACGTTIISPVYHTPAFNFCLATMNYYENCNFNIIGGFDINNPGCMFMDQPLTFFEGPLIYQVTNTATGSIVAADTLEGWLDVHGSIISGLSLNALPNNVNYTITIKDKCGNVFNQDFIISEPTQLPPVITQTMIYPDACVDSSAFVFIFTDNFRTEPKLVFLSGPTYMGSTKPGYEYTNSHAYPDTIPIGGIGATTHRFDIYGLSPGTYQYKIFDTCGSEVYGELIVWPTAVTNFGHHFWYRKGCLGRNELHYTVNTANGTFFYKNLSTGIGAYKTYNSQDWANPITDSVMNLPSGTYEVIFYYYPYFSSGTQFNEFPLQCQVITDTVVIEGYQTPTIFNNNYIQCHSSIYTELIPDSTKGVPPYQYEIISGPQVFPVQSSNLFELNAAGVYTIRIYDVCGNGSTAEITVDPIVFPPMNVIPYSCNSTSLTYGSSVYYTYNWIAPNGTVYTGDTLNLDPLTPADTGWYVIQKIININGCTDTFYSNYHVGLNYITEQHITICNGNSVTIGPHTYNATGIYTDTLLNVNNCDSIIVLHLTVVTFLRDSIEQTICIGDSYNFNGQLYSQTGYYQDTLSTSTCDSIITLHLTVNDYKRDSVIHSICAGQDYLFNGQTYNQAGIYSDTLSTAACDSIVFLVLTVNPIDRDSIYRSICTGESYLFNGQQYTLPGIYSDTLSTATCDSIVVLNLTVEPLKRDTIYRSVCAGNDFNFNGQLLNLPGTYADTLNTSTCDSIVVLNLTVEPLKHDTIYRSVCAGNNYNFNGQLLNLPGTYSDTLSTSTCDSIVVLQLTVQPLKRDSVSHSMCAGETYTFNGQLYSQAGFFSDTLSTSTCDSIVVLHLIITPVKQDSIIRSVCWGQSYTVSGNTYTQTGIYHDTLSTATCDSIVILNLTVQPLKHDSIVRTLCAGESYTVNGNVYTQSGIYHDTLSTSTCDSVVVLNLTITPLKRDTIVRSVCYGESYQFNGQEFTQPGFYNDTLSTTGCDSVVTLNLSIYPNSNVVIWASANDVEAGTVIHLNASAALSYLWTSSQALISDPGIQNPTAVINNDSWIYLTTTNETTGCAARDSVFINIRIDTEPCKGAYIYIPAAFTPNQDGLNDIIRIKSKKITLNRFSIYNRWGEKVFETHNINDGWDGRYKGKMVLGAYVYMISYRSACDSKLKLMKGSVVLIR